MRLFYLISTILLSVISVKVQAQKDSIIKANNNKVVFVNNLEKGLVHLNNSIANKVSPIEIMMIVHTEIHPNLLEAFNLELRK